ncbi:MAG TPA: DUF255 domain-containing protein [Candidatus Eisenbacteria bacterium]
MGPARVPLAPLAAAILLLSPNTPARAEAPGLREARSTAPRAKRDGDIRWQSWGPAAFQKAKREGKLVLLDLTAVWCHWCHVMDETTYSDSEVIRILNTRFIPIRVDADRYPQITDRYLSGGWPTTAVLTAEGHVLASQTYVPPEPMKRMLAEVQAYYWRNRDEIARRAQALDRAVGASRRSPPPDSAGGVAAEEPIRRTLQALQTGEDREHGGFGGAPKFHNSDAVAFLFREARLRRDPEIRAMAVRAVDGAMRLEDSVWGGYFRYATRGDWSAPHFEKLLSGNAQMLSSLALAYRETGARRYFDAALRTAGYVNGWLGAAPARIPGGGTGGWFGSQDADLGSHDPDAAFRPGEEYFALGDGPRRRAGIPHIDSTIYVDANASMVSALVEGIRALVFPPQSGSGRERAAMDRIWREGRAPDGSLYHALTRRGGVSPGLLRDQALAGLAYLDLYEATGDTIQLERARALRSWIRAHLEDRVDGGFRYGVPGPDAVGRERSEERSPQGSVPAAALFLRLYWLDGRAEDLATVNRTLAWLRSGDGALLDPAVALLVERAAAVPVRIAMVGCSNRGAAEAFLNHAYRADAPEIVVRLYDEGGPRARWGGVTFPAEPSPALYVCGDRLCSPPITDRDAAGRKIRDFLAAGLR